MKYILSRASYNYTESITMPPVEGCVVEEVHEILWDGRIDNDTVKRWTLGIDDLITFVNEHGSIILGKSGVKEIPYHITIYDGYVE